MRCDVYLFQNGFAESRSQARTLIEAGSVCINGKIIKKASDAVDEGAINNVEITSVLPYVSRGGLKLDAALRYFGIDVGGCKALDIGASTGGFTDCLLQSGASSVIAVDSGENQMAKRLRDDDRVQCIEKYNARYMKAEDFSFVPDIAVMDVSFISQTLIFPSLADVMPENGVLISLIKPQFEAGKSAVGKNGIVKKTSDRRAAIERVVLSANAIGFGCFGLTASPIEGGDGNIEFLAAFRKGASMTVDKNTIERVAEGKP